MCVVMTFYSLRVPFASVLYISSYDSGGPIIIPNGHHHGDLLVGLVSWGEDCGDPDFPAVNARVSEVSDWIDEVVCQISEHPPADFCSSGKWRFSFTSGARPMGILLIASLVGAVVFRKRKNTTHKSVEHSPALTEQESLCESCSSSEDYQAIEME